jgi:hypothetical protein
MMPNGGTFHFINADAVSQLLEVLIREINVLKG